MLPHQVPLNSLRVLAVAARHGSFVRAAEELHVTHGAVSRQIRLLEEALGLSLFERRNRAVFLTPEGRQLAGEAQQALQRLDSAVAALRQPQQQRPLVVSCEPTLAIKWLIPRLGDFYRAHPSVQLHISTAGGPVQWQKEGIDVALRRNDFRWDEATLAEKICDEWIAPVCAPGLLRRGRLPSPWPPLLHTSSRRAAWDTWCALQDMARPDGPAQTYEHFYLSLQAAGAGLGIAIASAFMVQEELQLGRLSAPLGWRRDGSAYYLLSAAPFDADPRRRVFLSWLRRQMVFAPD